MRFSTIAVTSLLGGVSAAHKLGEADKLAAKGMHNLQLYAAEHGLPSPDTCTLENVAVRREW
jgi:tyrosinase